jgi:integrase/recombinase XerD
MTALAPHLAAFLRRHLPVERRASPATLDTYAHALRLLVCFAAERLGVRPSRLEVEVEALDAPLVLDFLHHLETGRGNSARTRNARLAAVNALFRYLEYRLPACLDQAQRIRAIPVKRTDEALVRHLTREEVQALLDAPAPRTATGARDRAMLHLAFAAGLRVPELVGCALRTSASRPSRFCMSWARDGASGSCPCGGRQRPRCAPGSQYARAGGTRRCSSMPGAES